MIWMGPHGMLWFIRHVMGPPLWKKGGRVQVNDTISGKGRCSLIRRNLFPAELDYLNIHPLEVVSRYRDPQLKVGENNFI